MIEDFLNSQYQEYCKLSFIEEDPILVPHKFSGKQDIEIAGFISATIAWGQRKSIIKNALRVMEMMDFEPYQFVTKHEEADLKPFRKFCHRTFQPEDILYFIKFMRFHYETNDSFEQAFLKGTTMEERLNNFKSYFFSIPDFPERTKKHVASPAQKSSCKRINMFLRWMVRKDRNQVDFGIWKNIKTADLICPLDVHVGRVARELGLLKRKQNDWRAAVELTETLKMYDNDDPVKYDYALFGTGINNKMK